MTRLTARSTLTVSPASAVMAAAAAAALAVLLTGCGTGGATPTTPPATSTTPSPTASAPASPSPSASVDPDAPAGQCTDDALEVAVLYVDSGAGSLDYSVVFTNTGSDSCELRGAPGVSVVDASGVQIGEAAGRLGDDDPPTLTLEPGASVAAALNAVNIDPDGGPLDDCPVVQGSDYLVYPPHSFTGVTVSTGKPVPACESTAEFLHVGPVQQQG
ncbi:DUF4232 domain-containing protein [Agromyces sp. NPDC055520]